MFKAEDPPTVPPFTCLKGKCDSGHAHYVSNDEFCRHGNRVPACTVGFLADSVCGKLEHFIISSNNQLVLHP